MDTGRLPRPCRCMHHRQCAQAGDHSLRLLKCSIFSPSTPIIFDMAASTRSHPSSVPASGNAYVAPSVADGLPSPAEPAQTRQAADESQHDQSNLQERQAANTAGQRAFAPGNAEPDGNVKAAATRSHDDAPTTRTQDGSI